MGARLTRPGRTTTHSWRGAGVVERGGLENRCAGNPRTEGSNPSLSASPHQPDCPTTPVGAAPFTPAKDRADPPAGRCARATRAVSVGLHPQGGADVLHAS